MRYARHVHKLTKMLHNIVNIKPGQINIEEPTKQPSIDIRFMQKISTF